MTFTVKVLLTSMIRTVCKYNRFLSQYHICPRTFFFGDAVALLRESYTLSREIPMFLAAIWSSLCFWSSRKASPAEEKRTRTNMIPLVL